MISGAFSFHELKFIFLYNSYIKCLGKDTTNVLLERYICYLFAPSYSNTLANHPKNYNLLQTHLNVSKIQLLHFMKTQLHNKVCRIEKLCHPLDTFLIICQQLRIANNHRHFFWNQTRYCKKQHFFKTLSRTQTFQFDIIVEIFCKVCSVFWITNVEI